MVLLCLPYLCVSVPGPNRWRPKHLDPSPRCQSPLRSLLSLAWLLSHLVAPPLSLHLSCYMLNSAKLFHLLLRADLASIVHHQLRLSSQYQLSPPALRPHHSLTHQVPPLALLYSLDSIVLWYCLRLPLWRGPYGLTQPGPHAQTTVRPPSCELCHGCFGTD